MSVESNGKAVNEPNHLYVDKAYFSTLINFSKETQKTRLLCEGWTKDTTGQMGVTDVAGDNDGLRTPAAQFASRRVVELIGRPHLEVFQQDRLIPPGVDVHLKLIPSANNFVYKSAAPQNAQQQNYNTVIQFASLIIHKKQLTSDAEKAHRELLQK